MQLNCDKLTLAFNDLSGYCRHRSGAEIAAHCDYLLKLCLISVHSYCNWNCNYLMCCKLIVSYCARPTLQGFELTSNDALNFCRWVDVRSVSGLTGFISLP